MKLSCEIKTLPLCRACFLFFPTQTEFSLPSWQLLVLLQQRGGQATEDVFSAGGACAHPEQGQALGSASSFFHQPGISTAPCRKATHSQLLHLELLRVSSSRQDLKCIKSNLCSKLVRQQESHTDFPPHSLTTTLARPLHQPW